MARLKSYTALLFEVSCLFSGLAAARRLPAGECKAYPGSFDWPQRDTWDELNNRLGGRLLTPEPPAAACHQDQPSFNQDKCTKVAEYWKDYDWHTENPVSVMWDQFTNYTCQPDPNTPCSGRAYPAYVVNATSAEHVKIAIDFARENNVRLNVKNTGHDFLGRSIAPGALSIWTHHLNSMEFHKKQFKLSNSDRILDTNAFTVGSGVQLYNAYKTANELGQTIVGGRGKSVGFGGYIAGGGHSYLSPHFGLAIDNVLQLEVVTPDGQIQIANEDCNPDLFWAFRGGGGSTFGVITKITIIARPIVKITQVDWAMVADAKEDFIWDLMTFAVSKLRLLSDSGLSGLSTINSSFANPSNAPGQPRLVGGAKGSNMMVNADDPDAAQKAFQPIKEALEERWPGKVTVSVKTKQFPSFFGWYEKNFNPDPGGFSRYLVSRLLDREALEGDEKALQSALKAADEPNGQFAFYTIAGRGVQTGKPRGEVSANPAWRKAYVHAITGAEFPPLDPKAKQEAIEVLQRAYQPFRDLTPKSGAYINEAFVYEKNWQQTFWGSNYERLLEMKRKLDPTDVFWCHPCVGHDRWQQRQDGRLCKAAAY